MSSENQHHSTMTGCNIRSRTYNTAMNRVKRIRNSETFFFHLFNTFVECVHHKKSAHQDFFKKLCTKLCTLNGPSLITTGGNLLPLVGI